MDTSSILVIKVGGAPGVELEAVCQDAALLLSQGQRLVIVHGGSGEANALGQALGQPPRFITSPSGYTSRHTDPQTMQIFMMAVNGKINSLLVESLQKKGVNALGLSGLDGRLVRATRKETVQSVENGKRKIIRDDYTGKIESVDAGLLHTLLAGGFTPVIAPLAAGQSGEALNVDADRAAAQVAGALQAERLILLTAVAGLMRAFPDESTLIERLPRARLAEALAWAEGRMKKKVLGAEEALAGGVGQVTIADGRIAQPITAALMGGGTLID